MAIVTQAVLKYPECGFAEEVDMPADACQYFYQCRNCKVVLKPKVGDCCVFCSYGTIKCPPKQIGGCCK
jgi:hypothetical protein